MVPYTYDVRCVRQFAGGVDARTGQPVAVVNVNVGRKEGRKKGGRIGQSGDSRSAVSVYMMLSSLSFFPSFFPRSMAPYRTVSKFSSRASFPPYAFPEWAVSLSLDRRLLFLREGAIQSRERNWILNRLLVGVSPLSLFPLPPPFPPVLIPVHDLVLAKPEIMRASNFMSLTWIGVDVTLLEGILVPFVLCTVSHFKNSRE